MTAVDSFAAILDAVVRVFATDVPDHELYDGLTQMVLPKPARDYLEALMTALNYQWVHDSEVVREIKEKVLAEGKAEGKAESLLAFLSARGFSIDDGTRDRVTGCGDPDQLNAWIVAAANAPTLAEVFD